MKSAVVLLLCASALASPSLPLEFLTGLSEGSEGPRFCFEHPMECGKTAGQLFKIFSTTYEKYVGPVCFACAQDFLAGLTNGLRATNATTSACVSDFEGGNYDLASLYEIIWSMVDNYYVPISLDGMLDLTCSVSAVLAIDFVRDCNFQALLNNLVHISPDILVQEYMDHMCAMNTAIYGVVSCSSDFTYCGYSVGTIVKTMLNWAI